ncbi:unnamed protein product, partial [Mesorhabditis belari]|uniref:Nucleoporin Nup120/160 beta-propeller domain-containing protein n=1 Tax=Mesorhabditis belari TaxID=2138241 RepID=A0AAF3ER75_9BILA
MTSSHEQTTVSIIRDEELLFSDGFAYIPNLTLTIEHEALQSPVPMNVTVDGDVFTFPDESLFNDRFITWRGMGQKMFLEERSLQSSLQFSICLFFPHAPILPGTTITVLNDVLFLIVPTQISIHRFYIYLPKSVTMKDPILKCFEGNDEMCFHHEVHSIQSHGNPIKASIAQNLLATTVLLVTFEGMLTHINMPTDKTKEVEETTLKGSGMIRRLLKRASTGYSRDKDSHHALDISVLQANEQRESPLFFAIYRDLCVRVWNGEHRSLLKTIEFDKMISKINADDLNNVTVKATIAHNGEVMLMVTINTKNNTLFLLLKENGTQYEKIAYFSAPHFVSKCSLIDSDLKHLGDGYWKVMGLWNDSSSRSSYRLLHITIEEINHEREQRRNDLIHPWRAVMTASSSSIISPSETTLEEIHSILFNRDQHSLEVLTRAIQIVCRGQHNDSTTLTTWVELEKFVENYSMTSEFDEKFCNDGSLKKEDGFLMLLRKIYTKCTELERSMNSPIKIFQMSSSSCHFWGVLRHGSVTIVEETAKVLLKNLALNDFKAWSRSMDDLVKYTEMALACSSQEEDIDDEYLSPPFPRLTSLEIERLLSGAQTILQHIQKMTAKMFDVPRLPLTISHFSA